MGNGMPSYKFARVIKMDREGRYAEICTKNKPIENNLEKQLRRFKSTLNTGGKCDRNENK